MSLASIPELVNIPEGLHSVKVADPPSVDFTNPVLGGGFGPGFKIVGGFDFVGDAFNGSSHEKGLAQTGQC